MNENKVGQSISDYPESTIEFLASLVNLDKETYVQILGLLGSYYEIARARIGLNLNEELPVGLREEIESSDYYDSQNSLAINPNELWEIINNYEETFLKTEEIFNKEYTYEKLLKIFGNKSYDKALEKMDKAASQGQYYIYKMNLETIIKEFFSEHINKLDKESYNKLFNMYQNIPKDKFDNALFIKAFFKGLNSTGTYEKKLAGFNNEMSAREQSKEMINQYHNQVKELIDKIKESILAWYMNTKLISILGIGELPKGDNSISKYLKNTYERIALSKEGIKKLKGKVAQIKDKWWESFKNDELAITKEIISLAGYELEDVIIPILDPQEIPRMISDALDIMKEKQKGIEEMPRIKEDVPELFAMDGLVEEPQELPELPQKEDFGIPLESDEYGIDFSNQGQSR
ncbi:MAG: hypothetical protein GX951_00190 [Mollicutes bacterium]|nr:hypothetical protein [Mollicutes bacterium]